MKSVSSPYFHNLDIPRKFTFNCIYISIFQERKEQKTLSSDVFYAISNFSVISSLLRVSQDCQHRKIVITDNQISKFADLMQLIYLFDWLNIAIV